MGVHEVYKKKDLCHQTWLDHLMSQVSSGPVNFECSSIFPMHAGSIATEMTVYS